ncbi:MULTISPECIES: siphovirus Gp157 family protein [Photorhabdus]|nr:MULTISPECIES: siphovirus Gp157 family protein [Photorhabdus]MCT8341970.1 siphovirus Gp157 family protein [Photorhabdus kleinii]
MTTTAIALAADYEKLQQLVETGEFSPEDIADTLESIECTIGDKLDAIMIHVRNIEGQAKTLADESKRLTDRKKSFERQVKNLTPAILKTWIQKRSTALKTIRNNLSFLRSAIDEAVTDCLISMNPVNLVTASRYQTERIENDNEYIVDPLSPNEVTALLSAASNKQKQWENLFLFAIHTGLRSSELCALRWQDIDFIGKTVHVQSARVVGIIKGTKTKAGTRKVELDTNAISALLNQKTFTFMKGGVVFEDPKKGEAWAGADAIRKKAWVPTLKKAGIRYRNPYQTRHTFATKHISQGVNLFWLAAQMGHKGPEMLFRHYGSYLKEYDNSTYKPKQASSRT